jgi:ATP-dependent Clp protease ATP-binding subunit ClpB
MTSNIGSHLILEEKDDKKLEQGILQLLRQQFRPEFLNRIDEVVIFNHLGREQISRIIEQHAGRLNRMLKDRGVSLEFTPDALELLTEKGYDRDFGARPMKRVFQREIQNPLAVRLLEGKFKPGTKLKVRAEKGEFRFE